MITITANAADQIQQSVEQGRMDELALRIAIQCRENGSFHYMMGFDDNKRNGDQYVNSAGIQLVIDSSSQPLVQGMTIDFIELEGKMEFIFRNPNDPNYVAPAENST